MPIKNTDGSIFQLKKPNPLLKTQDTTGDTHIVHNFAVQEVLVKYSKKKKPVVPNGAVVSTPDLGPAIEEQRPAHGPDIKPMPPPQVVEREAVFENEPRPAPVVEEEDEDDLPTQDIVSCWCQPAEYKKYVDPLYGETRRTPHWGDKFMFEGTILDSSEMSFTIWAQVKITPPSIIYIRSERRWWQVTNVQPHDAGFAMTCLPSPDRPSFG